MIKFVLPILLAAGVAVVAVGSPRLAPFARHAATGTPASRHSPVLVELYQSQGCSSCPPANANLNAIAARADVVALSFAVTYWDQLGWKDSFARPQYTARQWDYAHFNRRDSVATPQMWINGRETIVGGNAAQLAEAIRRAPENGPSLQIVRDRIDIGSGARPRADVDVWLARFDPRTIEVAIRTGENGGRTLPHRNIVKSLIRIGRWSGPAAHFVLPPASGGLASAVFLQAGKGGPVLAAAKS